MKESTKNSKSYFCLGGGTFCRKALGKPLCVYAIVVYHVVLLHPLQSLLTC